MTRARSSSAPAAPSFFRHLNDATDSLQLSGRAATDADLSRVTRSYGNEIGAFGHAAAGAVARGGTSYEGLRCTAGSIESKADRFEVLEKAEEAMTKKLELIRQEKNLLRVDIGGDVDLVLQTTDATLQNPRLAAEHDTVREAAKGLTSLRDGRNGRRRAAVLRTRSLKTGFADTHAETLDRTAELQAELTRARLEIQYLSGERLRPADLAAAPAPTAPRPGRRRPR